MYPTLAQTAASGNRLLFILGPARDLYVTSRPDYRALAAEMHTRRTRVSAALSVLVAILYLSLFMATLFDSLRWEAVEVIVIVLGSERIAKHCSDAFKLREGSRP